MNNSNESYLKETRKLYDKITYKFLMPVLYIVFLCVSPPPVLIFTIVLSPLLFILFFNRKLFSKKFAIFSFVIYLTGSTIYSCLPWFQYRSFLFFHPSWTEAEGRIIDYKIRWTPTTKHSAASSTASITYTYRVGDKEQRVYASEATRRYSNNLWNTDCDIEGHNLALDKQIKEYINAKNYKILINRTDDSRLFIPLDYFSFWVALPLQIILMLLKIIVALAIIISLPYIYAYVLERIKENQRRKY
ncbi:MULTISPECIES: hypothetical protein [Sphingobacterium]|uniref:hypothetical protein n=1 Tax=Sphingobacterium TaxID=28453 RepID=UPI00257E7A93|nr:MULTISPECIES: hypothetical protein [Sphingobacterium]